MLRKWLAMALCLMLALTSLPALAQEGTEAPDPEKVVGQLFNTLTAEAAASGQQLQFTYTMGMDDADFIGEQGAVISSLLGAIVYSMSVQTTDSAEKFVYNFNLGDDKLFDASLSHEGDEVYISSSLLGDKAYKFSITEAIGTILEFVEQNAALIDTSLLENLAVFFDPQALEPYMEIVNNWISENIVFVQETENVATAEHPDAAYKLTLNISAESLRDYFTQYSDVMYHDKNMLGLMAALSGDPSITPELLEEELEGQREYLDNFYSKVLGDISLSQLYNANDKLINAVFKGGINIYEDYATFEGEPDPYYLNVIYDLATVDGVASESVVVSITGYDGTFIKATASTELNPVSVVNDVYSQTQRFFFSAEGIYEGESFGFNATVDSSKSTSATNEKIWTSFQLKANETLADLLASAGLPIASYNITVDQETKLTETGWVSDIQESVSYLNAEGKKTLPTVTSHIKVEPGTTDPIELPTDALDLLKLTIPELVDLQGVIKTNAEAFVLKLQEYLFPGYAEFTYEPDAIEEATSVEVETVETPSEAAPETVPAG